MQEIAKENLDFNVFYESDDEMGALCSSFEEMRKAIRRKFIKELWKMIEEKKKFLQNFCCSRFKKSYYHYKRIHRIFTRKFRT